MTVMAVLFAAQLLLSRRVDSDLLWHIRTGQWIIENGRIPASDVFSWIGAEKGLAWTPHEWLFDIVLWGLYSSNGLSAVYALTSLTYGAFVLLVFLLAYRRSGEWMLSLLMALVAMLGVAPFLAPRPQVVTFALLTAVALMLECRKPYLAVATMLVGINIHGAMYPVYLGLFLFYCLPRRNWLPLVLAGICTLLTPIGLRLLPYPLFAFDSQVVRFREYAPTVLAQSWALLLAFIAIFLFVERKRVPLWDGLLVLMISLLAISARRHATLFFGIAWPMLAPFAPSLSTSAGQDSQAAGDQGRTGRDTGFIPEGALAIVLLVAILALGIRLSDAPPIDPNRGYPAAAVSWIKETRISRLWNHWGDGGYLIYRGVPTFVDGRADPFSPFFDPDVTIARDWTDAHYLNSDPRDLVHKYNLHYVLIDRDFPLYRVLSQSRYFDAVYTDDAYAVFSTELAPSSGP